MGPVPAGTGLGSSGAWCVGLLSALHGLAGTRPTQVELIEQACELEIERLSRPVGKHDQYICGLGGLRRLIIDEAGGVRTVPASVTPATSQALQDRLALFYTGVRRNSGTHLAAPSDRSAVDRRIEELHRIRHIGGQLREALEGGDVQAAPELMREHWSVKRAGPMGPMKRNPRRWTVSM